MSDMKRKVTSTERKQTHRHRQWYGGAGRGEEDNGVKHSTRGDAGLWGASTQCSVRAML